ncbi:DUF1000-domain-containing protein [Trichodelitschia bisporula]|uniref:DUF1000-domain-containing protein n=1 Tax=Trichodelitschia bisporula TaxID=703511 RepID=A0A6G1IAL7_9PEZI|nr:DUF1000-domain-containing protein [Trichodelitschia bisporula]
MSKTVEIDSPAQLQSLIKNSKAVIVDFYATWCQPCHAIAPVYEQFSSRYSRANVLTFAKVDTDKLPDITRNHEVTAMPTFIYFENGQEHTRIRGGDVSKLKDLVARFQTLAAGGDPSVSSSSSGMWFGASLPRGKTDVTSVLELRGLDLMNADSDFGPARVLFSDAKPSALNAGKGKGKAEGATEQGKDWVESDTDDQLMLYLPFQSTVKVHTIHITSLPGTDDDAPMRPGKIHFYVNKSQTLGFEEAEDTPPTQAVELSEKDWDSETGTAKIELRFVKFQNVFSLVIFVVNGDGDGERVRIDRLRILGETGEKRDLGKLEKIGDEAGE